MLAPFLSKPLGLVSIYRQVIADVTRVIISRHVYLNQAQNDKHDETIKLLHSGLFL